MPAAFYPALYTINGAWLAFMGVWLVLAFNTKRTVYREPVYQRLTYFAGAVAAFFLLRRATRHGLPVTSTAEVLGAVLCVLGIGLAIMARLQLGRNWSGMVTVKKEHTLITTGPYRFVRHPIYTGILAAIFGTFLALIPSLSAGGVFVLFTAIFYLKLRREEKLMRQTFPTEYPAYQQRVKALIPFVM